MIMHDRKVSRHSDSYTSSKMVYDDLYSFAAGSASGSSRHAAYTDSSRSANRCSPNSSRSPRHVSSCSSSSGQQARSADRVNGRVSSDYHHHQSGHNSSQRKRHTSRGTSDNSPRDRDRCRERERERDSVDERDRDSIPSSRRHDVSSCSDRLSRVGSWSEHVSSSGKRYYYNSSSEVSQWDKPAAWIEAERDRLRSDRISISGTQITTAGCRRSQLTTAVSNDSHVSTHSGPLDPGIGTDSFTLMATDDRHAWTAATNGNRRADGKKQVEVSSGDSTPTEESATAGDAGLSDSHQLPPVRLSMALSRLVQSADTANGTYDDSTATMWTPGNSRDLGCAIPSSTQTYSQQQPVTLHATVASLSGGVVNSAGSSCLPATAVPTVCGSSCLPPVGGSGQLPVTQLTLTHGQYYREQLVCHVQNWAATQMEKQAARVSEEAHHMASELMTKAATNLKMARSLVRLAEIQATLQEQRILFLQQQIQELGEGRCQDSFLPSN